MGRRQAGEKAVGVTVAEDLLSAESRVGHSQEVPWTMFMMEVWGGWFLGNRGMCGGPSYVKIKKCFIFTF